ncbi:hypothetical protein GCK72_015380 [Caenorhabditis remanei]|uniref:Tyrosine specific protein phosphatases domain-containing protein n=1 Tax=Caenorhabditis remanei TaxID=31234 RepID=A0A6A5GTX4_CAERE|nr:hypothetical protein GCK72_015380 [Caenorhabditis remanei]KAF1758920.1 hypothetical protein GCK72_015380 [Caenorhabditis remanei]
MICWCQQWLCFSKKKKKVDCSIIDLDEKEDHIPPLSEDLLVVVTGSMTFGTHFDKYEQWIRLLKKVMDQKRDETREYPFRRLSVQKYRKRSIKLNPLNSLQTLHGNLIRTRTNTIFYATQMPMENVDTLVDTRIDFLALIMKDEIEIVVMLGPTRPFDGKQYVALNGMYFCEATGGIVSIGSYIVETVKEEPFLINGVHFKDISMRTLKITDKKKQSRTIRQYQYTTWNEKENPPPNGYETVYELMKRVKMSQKPIMVHCTYGIGRTMLFIGLEYITSHLEIHDDWTFKDAFEKLIEKRYCSFLNAGQIGWLEVGVVYFMVRKYELEWVMFEEFNRKYLEMCQGSWGPGGYGAK